MRQTSPTAEHSRAKLRVVRASEEAVARTISTRQRMGRHLTSALKADGWSSGIQSRK